MALNAPLDDITNLSVLQFCDYAKQLLSIDQGDFVRFVLLGRNDGLQAYIDAIRNRLEDQEDIRVGRDYDSLLGISKHILVERYLTVYPVARKEDTLTHNIHIQYEFTTNDVCLLSFYCSSH